MAGNYFVRSRGRITGPFDVAALQKMVRRGLMSRLHELSEDRKTWLSAGEFEDLFPAPARAAATATASVASQPTGDSTFAAGAEAGGYGVVTATPIGAPVGTPIGSQIPGRFYYSQGGDAIGPVPLSVLRSLAQNGTLQPGDLVWQENAEVAVPAYQLTHLAALFSAAARPSTGRVGFQQQHPSSVGSAGSRLDPASAQRTIQAAHALAAGGGVTVGAVILLALNLPVFVTNVKILWWWDALGDGSPGWFALFCFFFLFVGLALCAVGPLVRGIARGIMYVSVAGVAFVLLGALSLSTPAPGETFISILVSYAIPLLAFLLIAASRAKQKTASIAAGPLSIGRSTPSKAGAPGASVCLVIFGATMLVAGLTSMICMLGQSNDVSRSPGWAVATFSLTLLSLLTGVVGGAIALGGSSKSFGPNLNLAVTILSAVSLGLLMTALIVVASGVTAMASSGRDVLGGWGTTPVDALPAAGFIFFLIARLGVLFWSLATIAGIGAYELFVVPFLSPAARRHHGSADPAINAAAAALQGARY